MPKNLYDASWLWALPLPDERFPSLDALQSFVETREKTSSEFERALKQTELKVLPEGSIIVNGNSPGARLSHWVFGQLCYSVGAPAEYFRTPPAEIA